MKSTLVEQASHPSKDSENGSNEETPWVWKNINNIYFDLFCIQYATISTKTHTHTQGAIVNWGTRSSKTNQTMTNNTNIFNKHFMDLQGAGHWLLHEILRLEQAEVLDAFRVCSVQLTYNFAYFACIGYSMPLQPPTNLLRTKHTNSNHHAENLGKNSAFSKTLRKSKGIFTHRKKKNKAVLSFSLGPYSNSHDRSEPPGPCDNEEDTSMSWKFKIKFYETEGTWRNMKEQLKIFTAYPSFS